MTEINQDKRYKYIFDEILTLTDDGFVVVDNHDVITDINEQYCQYLKTTREYAIGRSIAEIIPNTKMIDIVNYAYQEEGAILRLSEKSDDDSDRIFLVNRSAVNVVNSASVSKSYTFTVRLRQFSGTAAK